MGKEKVVFFCKECGYESLKWLGKCPGCNQWNTFVEEKVKEKSQGKKVVANIPKSEMKKLKDIQIVKKERFTSGFGELDRVLGGGIVDGSLILLGGEPGIGKSTLVLQISDKLTAHGDVLYVSGEESELQVKLRADRLGIDNEKIYFYGETDIDEIESKITENKPRVCIIDSIQTMYDEAISSVPGSVSQVREVTARLMNISKRLGIITIVIGHVTKDGVIAGPRLLEHMVDVVLYIEGERFVSHRIVRGVKNRFGSTNEIGIFEMLEKGMVEVTNMSEMFLTREKNQPGTVTTAILEGTSTLLLELQALTTHSYYNIPRRVTTGIDVNRLNLLLGVIEKVCGISLGTQDVYINVVGGIKITETASDLAVAMAIISSYKGKALNNDSVFIGELALTGEIRRVVNIEKRIKEAVKLGYKTIYTTKYGVEDIELSEKVKLVKVNNIKDLVTNG